jgi:large subunit ribosomal protein L6
MSRIGKLPILVPKNVKLSLEDGNLKITGPHGTLNQIIPKEINVTFDDEYIKIGKTEETRSARQKYGLLRSLVKNMIVGVTEKFEKKLQMIGVGYRAQVQGKDLILNVGYSHPVVFLIPDTITITIETNTNLKIQGIDKELIGVLASKIRSTRPPEPYKGKGIRYIDEIVLRKAGKSGKK